MLFLVCVILERTSFPMDIFLQIISSSDHDTSYVLQEDQESFKPDWISTQVNLLQFLLLLLCVYVIYFRNWVKFDTLIKFRNKKIERYVVWQLID